jgi:hypothetical protein
MAKRVVLDCDGCGEAGAETVGPFDLGDGPKEADLCEACQEKYNVPRLVMLAGEYGVAPEKEPAGYKAAAAAVAGESPYLREKANRKPTQCPRCDAAFWAGRMGTIAHLQRIHAMTLNEACHAVPFEGEGADCPEGCGFYGPVRGMAAHIRWHEAQREEGAA